MRVLYVTNFYKPAYVYGGPARSIPALCEGLAAAGASVTVFTTNANGGARLDVPLDRPERIGGVDVHYHALASDRFLYSPALVAAVAKHAARFDLVDIDCLFAHGLHAAARACRRARVPYVTPLRGQMLPWALGRHRRRKRLYLAAIGRRCLEGAAGLHCTDEEEAAAIRELGYRAPAFVVPNPVASAGFRALPPRGWWRERLGIRERAFVLLLLGRLHDVKRPEVAVRCLAAAASSGPPVHLIVAGPDEQGMSFDLRALADALHCGERLHILPVLDSAAILRAFADADLLLMPSRSENFGMAAAEAMAAGLPVLCSPAVPIGRIGAENGAAVCADPGDFPRRASELISLPAGVLRDMGARGRELIATRFDTSAVARLMLRHFEAIVAGGKPASEEGYVPRVCHA